MTDALDAARDAFADADDIMPVGEPRAAIVTWNGDAQERVHRWLNSHGYTWEHPENPDIPDGVLAVNGDPVTGDPRVFVLEPEVSKDRLRERLTDGEHTVHRLREWSEGDTLYGVELFNPDGSAVIGKTYREGGEYTGDAEERAREQYELRTLPPNGVTYLYRATIASVRTEPRDAADPGEPPLKFAELADVEILDWKRSGRGGSDE